MTKARRSKFAQKMLFNNRKNGRKFLEDIIKNNKINENIIKTSIVNCKKL